MTPVFKIRFNLTTIYALETADSAKVLHILSVSIGTLQMLLLIFKNSPFPCIIVIF